MAASGMADVGKSKAALGFGAHFPSEKNLASNFQR